MVNVDKIASPVDSVKIDTYHTQFEGTILYLSPSTRSGNKLLLAICANMICYFTSYLNLNFCHFIKL